MLVGLIRDAIDFCLVYIVTSQLAGVFTKAPLVQATTRHRLLTLYLGQPSHVLPPPYLGALLAQGSCNNVVSLHVLKRTMAKFEGQGHRSNFKVMRSKMFIGMFH